MDEAYKYQLEKMSDSQNEIRKVKNVSGLLDVSATRITVLSSYFEQVIELFDTWHFAVDGDSYSVWGYYNGKKYMAYPSIERLVNMLANHISNFAKVLNETEPNHKVICKCDSKTPKVEPVLTDLLENFFKDVPYPKWMQGGNA